MANFANSKTESDVGFFSKIRNVYRTWRARRLTPLRLEFVLTDYCNLNCVGCTHYSPLAPKEFEPFDEFKKTVARLGAVCRAGIDEACLIGGETLLYPRLVEAMSALRDAFPTQSLHLYTNGILLAKMNDEFWQTARDCRFVISITRYPIKVDYDALEQLCRDKGVAVETFGDRTLADSFFRFALDPRKRQNPRVAHFKCYNFGCVSVIGDYIYPCSISGCVDHLNRACGTHFEHKPGDRLAVVDVKSARDIRRLRDRAVPFCAYCIVPPKTVEYGLSRRVASEWVEEC